LFGQDFVNALWYKRDISIPKNFKDKRVFLNFAGVDFYGKVSVNSRSEI
jgi:hypothetical protein